MTHQLFSKLLICVLFVFQSTWVFSTEENFFLIDGLTEEVIIQRGPHIDTRFSPCSSFKMPLSVMGYDVGILIDEETPTWDFEQGYDDWIEAWRVPQTPLSWMQFSCVWYSKILSVRIGLDKIQNYLASMHYGNQDMSGGLSLPGPEDVAWINSSLQISAREQVDFVRRMVRGQLSTSDNAFKMTKALVFKEELSDGWKLFGKTGWSGSDITKDGKTLQHSWFVGWIEKGERFYPFAYLIRDKTIQLDQRIPRVKQLLVESSAMRLKLS
jgi:beta-lactamase class D